MVTVEETRETQVEKGSINYVQKLVYAIRILIDLLIDFVFSLLYSKTPEVALTSTSEPFLAQSSTSLARDIRTRKITSEKVVKGFVDRIEEVNGLLNAVVDKRYDEALMEAKEVDKFLAETKLSIQELETTRPFLGVPFTSKESTAATGMAFTFGLVSRKSIRATEDAVIVARMKESGAILIAVTNVPELNLWCETRNNVYGQTVNPYDIKRTVGGSSGGESCIITACGSPMGIGTDIGGSTRMPAFFCGIFGHKPTTGLISTKGMTFRTGTEVETMVTAGTMTRYSEDITPFLKLLLGSNCRQLKLDEKVNLKEIRCFYIDNPGDLRVSPLSNEMASTITVAAKYLASLSNSTAKKVDLSGFKFSLSLWRHWMTKEPSDFAQDLGNREGEVSLKTELPKLILGSCQFTLPAIMRLIDLKLLPCTNSEWAEDATKELREKLLEMLGDNGVLIFPSYSTDAPYHYASLLRPYNFAYWAIFNVLKFPVTQVPMGLSGRKLPLGVQVVAAPYNDHLTIAVAQELEKIFGGWVPPFATNEPE